MNHQPAKPPQDDPWCEATWEGHELAQLKRMATLPFAAKLAWLEETQRLAQALQANRRRMGLPVDRKHQLTPRRA